MRVAEYISLVKLTEAEIDYTHAATMPTAETLIADRSQEASEDAPIVLLTGAGISAESGIPTFRGEGGYWRIGSTNYRPEELATRRAFDRIPEDVWAWYLYRRGVCRQAEPNQAHTAVAELGSCCGGMVLLITQNVDGLHRRAGSPPNRTYEIHGNIEMMRCSEDCTPDVTPIPDAVDIAWDKDRALTPADAASLRCEACGSWMRPHVLWFDETYDEAHFRFESSIAAASSTPLLLVVGTTGRTNLPLQIGQLAARSGASLVVVNPEPNPFSEFAAQSSRGAFIQSTAGAAVPTLCAAIQENITS